jgi:hypothetical protein
MTDSRTSTIPARQPKPMFHTLLVFRCPTELSERLADFAAQHGISSISAAIRHLIQSGLKAV